MAATKTSIMITPRMDISAKPRTNSKELISANPAIFNPTEKDIACLTTEGGVFFDKNSRQQNPNINIEARLARTYTDSFPIIPKSPNIDPGNKSNDTKR
jgi:hypothetical protein